MLKLQGIFKAYDKPVLSDFSYDFPEKGLFVLRGASGIGKTTLLRLIAGLEKPDEGEVALAPEKRISFVFQEARLLPFLTVLENLLLVKKEKDLDLANGILKTLGLGEEGEKYPDELSGGMKLRAAIARSIYYGGDVYLWDEPTKELDPENRRTVKERLLELSREHLVIVVTHDPEIREGTEIVL